MKDALFEELKDNTGVSALVGTKVFYGVTPESRLLPAIIINQIGGDHDHHMGGANGLTRRDVQITSYAKKPKDAEAVAESVRNAIDGFHGTMGTVVTANVRTSHLSSAIDTIEPAASSKQSESIFGVNQSWTFWHTDTVPSL